ncbi:MAG: PEGA domain-containing protein [Algisphaera sp.]
MLALNPQPALRRNVSARLSARIAVAIAACLLLAATTPGCVQRRISITSRPAGALVYLNDQEVGRTPLTVPFTFYGTYDVRLEADDRPPLWTTANAKQPWWEYPGPDLFAELLPHAKSSIAWDFDIPPADPAADADVPALLKRAQHMRDETRGQSIKR